MKKIIAVWRLMIIAWFILCCLVVVKCVLPGKNDEEMGRIVKRWAGKLPAWLGIPVSLEGEKLPESALSCGVTTGEMGRLLVSNHMTFLDPLMIDAVMPSGFVAKAEIANWPFFGSITTAVKTIYIERGRKRDLLSITDNMEKALKAGRNVLIFPEGTTSSGEGILKMHANLFESAVLTGAETIPIVIRYKQNGKDTTLCSWTGHEPLFSCLWRIVNADNLSVTVTVLKPAEGNNRRELCRDTSAKVCAQIVCADPLATE